MPRSPEQYDALRRESQERLERAALTVFARTGFQRATVRDVAREAGVAQGLLYHYFRTKDELLTAVFRRGAADVATALAAAATPAGTPAERFAAFVRASFRLVDEHRDYWRLNHRIRHDSAVVSALGADLHGWTTAITSALAQLLDALGHRDPEPRARVLFAAIDGIAQHYLLDPEGYPLAPVIDALLATFAPPPR